MSNTIPRIPRSRVAIGRQTEPQGYNPYANGGFGIIPRRGAQLDICDRHGLARMAQGSPLRLLKLLPELHPAVGLALWNANRLACAPGDIIIEAVGIDDGAQDGAEEKGTAAIAALWDSLPSEIGGFTGLFTQLFQEAFLTGIPCVEAVPGPRLQGVAQVWPVDSVSVAFKRDTTTGYAVPLQRQIFPKTDAREMYQGYAILDPSTFFWHAVDSMVDEPYGRAPYAPAVAECLCDIAMMKDLRDAIHNAAWPRLSFAFNWPETYKIATEQLGMKEPDATIWVEARFEELRSMVNGLKPDDSVFHPHDADAKNLTPGEGFQALTGVLEFLQARVIQSLKSLPSIMGISLGTTETYGSIQWRVYALGLESIRDTISELLVKVANLHLQLLGMPLKAKARIQRIQTGEALTDANTEAIRLKTAREYVRLGMKTPDEASQDLVGHGIVDAAKLPNFDIDVTRLTEREQVNGKDQPAAP